MSLAFFSAFAATKADGLGKQAVDALVRFDPEGATQAQLRVMEQNLDTIGGEISKITTQHDQAQAAYNAAAALNGQRMKAAEILQGKLASASDADKPALQSSLEQLVQLMESAQSDMNEHKADTDSAQKDLDELKGAYQDAADKLKAAKRNLDHAQNEMARADREKQQALSAANAARAAAGLSQDGDSLNTALDAMQRTTTRTHEQAQAARLKAGALAPSDVEQDDPHIAAAMAEAAGKDPDHTLSIEQRLAALKAGPGSNAGLIASS